MKRPPREHHVPPQSSADVAVGDILPLPLNGALIYVRVLGVRAKSLRVALCGVQRVYEFRDGTMRELRGKP